MVAVAEKRGRKEGFAAQIKMRSGQAAGRHSLKSFSRCRRPRNSYEYCPRTIAWFTVTACTVPGQRALRIWNQRSHLVTVSLVRATTFTEPLHEKGDLEVARAVIPHSRVPNSHFSLPLGRAPVVPFANPVFTPTGLNGVSFKRRGGMGHLGILRICGGSRWNIRIIRLTSIVGNLERWNIFKEIRNMVLFPFYFYLLN